MSTAPAAEAISRKAPPPLRKSPGQSSLGIGAVIARKKMMRYAKFQLLYMCIERQLFLRSRHP
jgi:hypothetical protein